MSIFLKRFRKLVADRKQSIQESILAGTLEPSRYHTLCGAYTETLRTERDIDEVLETLKLDEEEED